MEARGVYYVEHGAGRPVLVLHGAGVDHREPEAWWGSGEIGDDEFRSYFVVQTREMLERYERYVAPAAALVDQAALERIGQRWELAPGHGPA